MSKEFATELAKYMECEPEDMGIRHLAGKLMAIVKADREIDSGKHALDMDRLRAEYESKLRQPERV